MCKSDTYNQMIASNETIQLLVFFVIFLKDFSGFST